MELATGSHRLGPRNSSLVVKTYREGKAAKMGHDLVIDVERWQATLDVTDDPAGWAIELSADPDSLAVREGVGGVKPLTDGDRADILKTIDGKALRGQPINFRSSSVRPVDGESRLAVEGELTLAGSANSLSARLDVTNDGHISGTVRLTQSEWGIEPHSALMGALKVGDELDVVIDARLR